MTRRIDLNADLGEECGDDLAMLAVVTSASIAAGGHAGGGDVLRRTVAAASKARVAVGAHPSYPDRAAFGRVSRADDHTADALRGFVAEQVASVVAACAAAGGRMHYVKAHGALYGDVAGAPELAAAFLAGIDDAAGPVAVLGPGGTALERACAERGIRFVAEGFADRAYDANGALVPRAHPRAVHADQAVVVAQAVALAAGAQIAAVDDSRIVVPVESLCVHGDTPGAVTLAVAIRAGLEAAGFQVGASWT